MELLNTIANNRFWNKYGISLAWAMAALCLLLAVLRVGWVSYSQAKVRASNYAPQKIAPLARPAKKGYRVGDIVAANMFGNPAPPPVQKKAPKTTLNLTLQGILSASDPEFARAIISSGKKRTSELYSVGESIKGAGASIKEIRPTEVLLNRNGAIESLPLHKSDKSGKNPIISYVNESDIQSANYEVAAASQPAQSSRPTQQQFSAANRSTTKRSRAPNGKPRKVRKPNFSGLDRALKKMGEL